MISRVPIREVVCHISAIQSRGYLSFFEISIAYINYFVSVKNCPYCKGSFLPGSDSYDEMVKGRV